MCQFDVALNSSQQDPNQHADPVSLWNPLTWFQSEPSSRATYRIPYVRATVAFWSVRTYSERACVRSRKVLATTMASSRDGWEHLSCHLASRIQQESLSCAYRFIRSISIASVNPGQVADALRLGGDDVSEFLRKVFGHPNRNFVSDVEFSNNLFQSKVAGHRND